MSEPETSAITIDKLVDKVPSKFQPLAREYGPAFLQMGQQEVVAWIALLARGNVFEAYQQVLANLPNRKMLDEWTQLSADWQSANEKNAERVELARRAQSALLGVLLTIALAAVGL